MLTNKQIKQKLWWGEAKDPQRLRRPMNMITVIVGFELMLWVYAAVVLARTNVATYDLESKVEEIVVRRCFIKTDCSTSFEFQSYNADLDTTGDGKILTIDGSGSLRCSIDMCIENRNNTLKFTVANSVINLRGLKQRFSGSIPFSVEVVQWDAYFDMTNKLFLFDASIPYVFVNISRGVVIANNVKSTNQTYINRFGTVILAHDFQDSMRVTGNIEQSNYCVHPSFTIAPQAACVTEGISCPFDFSFTNGTNPTVGAQVSVECTSVYVNEFYSNLTSRVFINQTRVAGTTMEEEPPKLHPKIYGRLNSTDTWAAESTIDDYVQAIEVVTPSVGILFMHARQRITMEIGPEYMSFLSAFALRPHYRRMTSPLSHYRCRSEHGREFYRSGSLINAHLNDPDAYDDWVANDFRTLLESHYNLEDQFVTANEIYNSTGAVGFVTFVSPATEFTKVDDLLGTRWIYYFLGRDEDGDLVEQPLETKGVAAAILGISVVCSMIGALGIMTFIIYSRGRILISFLMQEERELQRTMVDHKEPVPYKYFSSVLSIMSWLVFRLMLYTNQFLWYPGKEKPFLRFLSYYYRVPQDKDTKDKEQRQANSKFRKLSFDQLSGQYTRWCMLRYQQKTESKEDMEAMIDTFGSRRFRDSKIIVRGLKLRKKLNYNSRFALQYSVIQAFFEVTHNKKDFIMFDDLYYRAVIEDPSVTEELILTKLAQWKLIVERTQFEIIGNIVPRTLNPLNEEQMSKVVNTWEENCASYPTFSVVEWSTTGSERKKRRAAIWFMWIVLEAIVIFLVTFIPFILCYMIALPLEIEHARFSTSTSILLVDELLLATTDATAPRPQNIISTTIFAGFLVYLVCMMIEPILVALTFRTVGKFKWSLWFQVYRWGGLYIRVVLTAVATFCLVCSILFVMTYIFTVLIWWVLGAIIAPNRMLVYASSVGTFLFMVASAYTNMSSMRNTVINRLKEKIFQQILKMVRQSPAADIFEQVEDNADDAEAAVTAGVVVASSAPQISSGMVLDAVAGKSEERDKAIEAISTQLDAPEAIIYLGLAIVKREQALVRRAVKETFVALKLPTHAEQLALQLANQALGLPASAAELSHALYKLVPQQEMRLLEYDEVIVPIVQCALNRNFDKNVLVHSVSQIAVQEVASLADIEPTLLRKMFDCAMAVTNLDQPRAMKLGAQVLESMIHKVPEDAPPVLEQVLQVVVEGLKMGTNQQHAFQQAALELIRFSGYHKLPAFRILEPLMRSAEEIELDEAMDMDRAKVEEAGQELRKEGVKNVMERANVNAWKEGEEMLKKLTSLVTLKFSLSQEQLSKLQMLMQLLSGNQEVLESIPEELKQWPANGTLRGAVIMFDVVAKKQTIIKEFAQKIRNERLAANAEIAKHKKAIDKAVAMAQDPATAKTEKKKAEEEFARQKQSIEKGVKLRVEELIHDRELELVSTLKKLDDFHKEIGNVANKVKLLEAWVCDQWVALESLFDLVTNFPSELKTEEMPTDVEDLESLKMPEQMCDLIELQKYVGIPASALDLVRQGIKAVRSMAYNLFSEDLLHLARMRDGLLDKANSIADMTADMLNAANKEVKDAAAAGKDGEASMVERLLGELISFLLKDAKLGEISGMTFDRNFVKNITRQVGRSIVSNVANLGTVDRMKALSSYAKDTRGKKMDLLSKSLKKKSSKAVKAAEDELDSREATILNAIKDVLFEFVTSRTIDQGDVIGSIKKLAMTLLEENFLGLLPSAAEREEHPLYSLIDDMNQEEIEQVVDDVIDIYRNRGNISPVDIINLAKALELSPKVITSLIKPDSLLSNVKGMETIPTVFSILRGLDTADKSSFNEANFFKLLRVLGVSRDRMHEVKSWMAFLTEAATKIDDSELPKSLGDIDLDSMRASMLSTIRRREEMKLESLVALSASGVIEQTVTKIFGQQAKQKTAAAAAAVSDAQSVASHIKSTAKELQLTHKQLMEAVLHGVPLHKFLAFLHEECVKIRDKVDFRQSAASIAVEAGDTATNAIRKGIDTMLSTCFTLFKNICPELATLFRDLGVDLDGFMTSAKESGEKAANAAAGGMGAKRKSSTVDARPGTSGGRPGSGRPGTAGGRKQSRVGAGVLGQIPENLPPQLVRMNQVVEKILAHPVVRNFCAPVYREFYDSVDDVVTEVNAFSRVLSETTMSSPTKAREEAEERYRELLNKATDLQQMINAAFTSASPFQLIRSEVPDRIRQIFGVLFGIVQWFPKDIPLKVSALLSAAVTREKTSIAVLEIVSGVFPIKYRELALELLCIVCHRRYTVTAIADFVEVDVSKLRALQMMVLPTVIEDITAHVQHSTSVMKVARTGAMNLKAAARTKAIEMGDKGVKMAKDKVKEAEADAKDAATAEANKQITAVAGSATTKEVATHLEGTLIRGAKYVQWLVMLKEVSEGDPVAVLLRLRQILPALLDETNLDEDKKSKLEERIQQLISLVAVSLPQNASVREILINVFKGIDIKEMLSGFANKFLKEAKLNEFAKTFQFLDKKLTAIRAAKPAVAKYGKFACGVMYLMQNDFAMANNCFQDFAGKDKVQRCVLQILVLVIRIILEEGAVNDPQGVLSAFKNLLGCLEDFICPGYDLRDTLEQEYPAIGPILDVIAPQAEKTISRLIKNASSLRSSQKISGSSSGVKVTISKGKGFSLPKVNVTFSNDADPITILNECMKFADTFAKFVPAMDEVTDVLESILRNYERIRTIFSGDAERRAFGGKAKNKLQMVLAQSKTTKRGKKVIMHNFMARYAAMEDIRELLLSRFAGVTDKLKEGFVKFGELGSQASRKKAAELFIEAGEEMDEKIVSTVYDVLDRYSAEAVWDLIDEYCLTPLTNIEDYFANLEDLWEEKNAEIREECLERARQELGAADVFLEDMRSTDRSDMEAAAEEQADQLEDEAQLLAEQEKEKVKKAANETADNIEQQVNELCEKYYDEALAEANKGREEMRSLMGRVQSSFTELNEVAGELNDLLDTITLENFKQRIGDIKKLKKRFDVAVKVVQEVLQTENFIPKAKGAAEKLKHNSENVAGKVKNQLDEAAGEFDADEEDDGGEIEEVMSEDEFIEEDDIYDNDWGESDDDYWDDDDWDDWDDYDEHYGEDEIIDDLRSEMKSLGESIPKLLRVNAKVDKFLVLLPRVTELEELADEMWDIYDRIEVIGDFLRVTEMEKAEMLIEALLPIVCNTEEEQVVHQVIDLSKEAIKAISVVMDDPSLKTVVSQSAEMVRKVMNANKTLFEDIEPAGKYGFKVPDEIYSALDFADHLKQIMEANDDIASGGPALIMALLEFIVKDRNQVATVTKYAKDAKALKKKLTAAKAQAKEKLTETSASDAYDAMAMSVSMTKEAQDKVIAEAKEEAEQRSAAIKQFVPEQALPISQADHRKITLLLSVVRGEFQSLPDLIRESGVEISEEQLQMLVTMLNLMKSMKRLADGKGVGDLSAEDVVDIISMQIFNEFDIENRGQISYDQFVQALTRMGITLSTQESKLFFSKVDVDDSGYITHIEFKQVLEEIQERFQKKLIDNMGLSKEAIYIALIWTAVFIIFLLTFIILGVYGFSDGSQFTAVITGIMPACGTAVRALQDPNLFTQLIVKVDELVVVFFDRMELIS